MNIKDFFIELFEDLLVEEKESEPEIKPKYLNYIWFLVPTGDELPKRAMLKIKKMLGHAPEPEDWVEPLFPEDEPTTLRKWILRRKWKHDGRYARMYVWMKLDKNFELIEDIPATWKAGQEFEILTYANKKYARKFNQGEEKEEQVEDRDSTKE